MSLDDFARRSDVYMKRMDALNAAAARERAKRNAVNLAAYAVACAAIALIWSSLDTRHLFVIVIGAVVLRVVGNALVTSWCNAEIKRIKASLPLDEPT